MTAAARTAFLRVALSGVGDPPAPAVQHQAVPAAAEAPDAVGWAAAASSVGAVAVVAGG
jgi:hypothetical protein